MFLSLLKTSLLLLGVSFSSLSRVSVCSVEDQAEIQDVKYSQVKKIPTFIDNNVTYNSQVVDIEYTFNNVLEYVSSVVSDARTRNWEFRFNGDFKDYLGNECNSLWIRYQFISFYTLDVILYDNVNHIERIVCSSNPNVTNHQETAYFYYNGVPTVNTTYKLDDFYISNFSILVSLFNSGRSYSSVDSFNMYSYLGGVNPSSNYYHDIKQYNNYVLQINRNLSENEVITYNINTPLFSVNNGQYVYNCIRLQYMCAYGRKVPDHFYIQDVGGQEVYSDRDGAYNEIFFYRMSYLYYADFNSSPLVQNVVCYQPLTFHDDESIVSHSNTISGVVEWYDYQSTTLDNINYVYNNVVNNKVLSFYTIDISSVTAVLNKLGFTFEYSSQNVVIIVDNSDYSYLSDVFSLINLAYKNMTDLFKISLLPGLTLGVLFLIPFGITIILFIVKLFKR